MKKLIIGITGGFGTGKTTVAKILSSYGVKIIDADKIVHQILASSNNVSKRIIKAFGRDILDEKSKKVNRKKLGRIVFSKRKHLAKLCRLIHPQVIKSIKKELAHTKRKIIAVDGPLLIEAKLLGIIDRLIVVEANKKNQLMRIKKKINLSNSEIQRRMNAQISLSKKIKLADYVIDNNKSILFTKSQARKIYKQLIK